MKIRIDETNHIDFDRSVLKDIGRFADLPSWLLAIKDNTTTFHPLDCAVINGQKVLWVVRAGQVTENIDEVIQTVKSLPADHRNFPNTYTEILADSFERALFFNVKF
ncbi:hypothetical protein ACKX2L_06010 [Lachnospiraceae bacterium YH-ros2228]